MAGPAVPAPGSAAEPRQVFAEEAAAAAAGSLQLHPEPLSGPVASAPDPWAAPVRPTAAPQQAMSPGAAPFLYPSPERCDQPDAGRAPLAGAQRCITQAQKIKRLLVEKEATRSVNPFWANAFWQDVSAFELAEGPMEPDLRRLLIAGGYVGPGTVGAPRAALKAQLDSVILTGAPHHGAGAQAALEPGWLVRAVPDAARALPAGWAESAQYSPALGDMVRWEDQLAPDLPRAAPEIFRSCRSSGSANIRDWLHRHYSGAKDDNNPKRTDLWNAATEIDFAVARCSSAAELNQLLVSNDRIEIKLRRMAVEEYRERTGDPVGRTRCSQ